MKPSGANKIFSAPVQTLEFGQFWKDAALVDTFIEQSQLKGLRAVVALMTGRISPRMMSQQAVFVMPTSLDASFMKCFGQSEKASEPDSIVKLVLPNGLRNEARTELLRLNITRSSLFPGLKGFARNRGDNLERALSENPKLFQLSQDGKMTETLRLHED
jgi:hypothetical protein